MAAAQRVFRFSLFESCVLFFVAAAALFLVFVLGIRVGSEIQGYESAQETRAIRLPVGKAATGKSAKSHEGAPLNLKPHSDSDLADTLERPLSSTTERGRVEQAGHLFSTSRGAKRGLPTNPKRNTNGNGDALPRGRPSKTVVYRVPDSWPDKEKETTKPPTALFRHDGWSIQVHVTESLRRAEEIADGLRSRGFSVSINNREFEGRTIYRLRVDGYTRSQAQEIALSFRRDGKFGQAYLVSD